MTALLSAAGVLLLMVLMSSTTTTQAVAQATAVKPADTEVVPPKRVLNQGAGCPNDCKGNGECKNGRCKCKPGFGNKDCGFEINSVYQGQPVYEGLKDSPNYRELDLQGWGPGADLYEKLLEEADANTVIEVGVWKGASAAHMGKWLKKKGGGLLIAIDTWLGAPEFWGKRQMKKDDMERQLFIQNGWPTVYYSFTSNMVRSEIQDYVMPLPLPSKLATVLLKKHDIQADLIHIDAAHEYGSVREDIHLWWPFVRPGGILLGDDFVPYWAGVQKAVKEFALMCEIEYKVVGDVKWVIHKPEHMPSGLPYYCYHGADEHYIGVRWME